MPGSSASWLPRRSPRGLAAPRQRRLSRLMWSGSEIPGNRTDGIYNKDAYFEERKVAHNMLGEWLAPIVNGDEANKIVNFDTVFK